MKSRKIPTVVALALALSLLMSGCGLLSMLGGTDEAMRDLVQGNLDEIYLGQYNEEFLELTNTTEAEAEQYYLDGLNLEAQYFAQYFLIENLTDEIKAEIVELYKDIYSHSKYEVGEAAKIDDDTYGVPVTVYPMDIIQNVFDEVSAALDEYNAGFSDEEYNEIISDEDAYAAYDAGWAEIVIGMVRDAVPGIGYLDPVDMVVQVQLGDDEYWSIADNDFSEVDATMIYYP